MTMNDADEIQTTESQTLTLELEDSDNDIASSPTLARLIEEVRNEEELTGHAYNRMHNRHNRSR
ncbi:MAG: YhhA family cyclophane-containing RiPP [Nitrososphaerales archaeon]